MSNNTLKSSIKLTATAIALGLTVAPIASQADTNPFGMTDLGSGYMVVAGMKDTEGKCGEAKCGGDKAMEKSSEGKCGGDKAMEKTGEAKCGGDKAMEKSGEGKCGEAKCGGTK